MRAVRVLSALAPNGKTGFSREQSPATVFVEPAASLAVLGTDREKACRLMVSRNGPFSRLVLVGVAAPRRDWPGSASREKAGRQPGDYGYGPSPWLER